MVVTRFFVSIRCCSKLFVAGPDCPIVCQLKIMFSHCGKIILNWLHFCLCRIEPSLLLCQLLSQLLGWIWNFLACAIGEDWGLEEAALWEKFEWRHSTVLETSLASSKRENVFFCVSYWFNCFSGMTGFLPLTIVNLSLRLGTNQAMPQTIYCCSNSCSRC